MHRLNRLSLSAMALVLGLSSFAFADGVTFTTRTAKSGNWSDAATWENGKAPKAGDIVQVRTGHTVIYDVSSDVALRMVHVAGTLSFSREKTTRLDVGLLKVQAGEVCGEDGFVCAVHPDAVASEKKNSAKPAPSIEAAAAVPVGERPALEIGTADAPLPANVTATIRLVYFE